VCVSVCVCVCVRAHTRTRAHERERSGACVRDGVCDVCDSYGVALVGRID